MPKARFGLKVIDCMQENLKTPNTELPDSLETPDESVLDQFSWRRLIWPVLIAVAALAYAVYQMLQEGINPITDVNWTSRVFGMIGLGFLCMFLRDFGYIWRMRLLTDQKLTWRSAIEVTLLWEFSSAVSPSIVGGSALAIFMLIKEKISAGRSTAIVFITIFLDEVFYLAILPVCLLVVNYADIFAPLENATSVFGTGMVVGFWIAYCILFSYTTFLAFALFIRPEATSRLLKRVFRTRLLKRWEEGGARTADELLISSREFRAKDFRYWFKAGLATCFAWFGRYLVVNCLLAAFAIGLGYGDHLVAFARQAIMFVVMLISPTPGSSGVAEEMFALMLRDYTEFIRLISVMWRGITYYPYLLLGVPLLPIWFRRVSRRSKSKAE
ncbi:MAG: lysylphosphatidylglycerol synthase transmembrane domain-containing protein [Bacteroidota bacterium]